MDEELTADLPLWFDKEAYELLCQLCEIHQIPPDVFS